MNALIIDGDNLIGNSISDILEKNGFIVSYIKLSQALKKEELKQKLENQNIIINISYYEIFENKIINIDKFKSFFHNIIDCIISNKSKPSIFITTSSTTLYADKGIINESSISYNNDDISNLNLYMEENTSLLKQYNTRLIILRLPIILDNKISNKKVFRLNRLKLHSNLIQEKNFFTWVSLRDFKRALNFIFENEELDGVFNITNPRITNNGEFIKAINKKYGKSFIKAPKSISKKFFRNYIHFFDNYKVQPKRLLENKFHFKDINLSSFIESI